MSKHSDGQPLLGSQGARTPASAPLSTAAAGSVHDKANQSDLESSE